MEQYLIIIKQGSKQKYLCLGDRMHFGNKFSKKQATIFFDLKDVIKAKKALITKEYSLKKRDASQKYETKIRQGKIDPYHGDYYLVYNSFVTKKRNHKVVQNRIEFNKSLKQELEKKYEIRVVKINTRVLVTEKVKY